APERGPVQVEVAVPLGQERRRVADGDTIAVAVSRDGAVEVGVVLTALEPGPVTVRWPGGAERISLEVPGARHTVRWPLDAEGEVPVQVLAGDDRLAFSLEVARVSVSSLRDALPVRGLAFPTDAR